MLKIIQLPVLIDNYIYIIHESESGETAVIDPAVPEPVLAVLKEKGWSLKFIFNTHHHWDHVGANLELKEKTNCQVLASGEGGSQIPGVDRRLKEGDKIKLGGQKGEVIFTPGHTKDHIVLYFESSHILFCGDTLFSMGCGRLFEGTVEQMWHSLQKIKSLPKETQLYCTHEYTQTNGRFALTLEPNNVLLQQRISQVDKLRADKKATVPSTLEQELATNPFLREDSLALQQSINRVGCSPVSIFGKIRQLKDGF